ncbi:helix-turn-helix domain-containing protein [Niabella beijingensis]|uniref:helix-turn-helix domain-containing protein n=1 Tax=Niabella beijingensis TaxID=2872700 RepID=UPI001CBD7F10|nr:helix-turn-helix domain-containing protein [Niabella beijingensis]MBZ4189415.1 helix-turn-helix domain-containing protein [Niabella beijingensis]
MGNKDGYYSYRTAVPPAFEEVFTGFYFAENRSDAIITQKLLPSFQTIMVFGFGTPAVLFAKQNEALTLNKCLVIGPIKQAFDYALPPQSELLVANFKGDAFFRFFGNVLASGPLLLHPDALVSDNCFTALWYALHLLNDNNDRVNYILDFCVPYLQRQNPIASQMAGFNSSNRSLIKEISKQQRLSERSMQSYHKKYFGYSAKEMDRYQRFLKAIQRLQTITTSSATKVDWFEIIDHCGYYDQSQLIHDFKHYLDLSPTQYLKLQEAICHPAD